MKFFSAVILITGAMIFFSGCSLMYDSFYGDGGHEGVSTESNRGNDARGGHRH